MKRSVHSRARNSHHPGFRIQVRILHCRVPHCHVLQQHPLIQLRQHRARRGSSFVHAAQRSHRQRREQRRRKPFARHVSQIKSGGTIREQKIIQEISAHFCHCL